MCGLGNSLAFSELLFCSSRDDPYSTVRRNKAGVCVRVCGRVRAHACVRVREKESEGERESAWHGVSAYVC